MKLRKIVMISILALLGVACAGVVLALYTDFSSKPSAPDGLSNIPSDYDFVFGVNVQKLVKSSAFSKVQQKNPIGKDLAEFTEKTGLDPARDVFYLVGAGRTKEKNRSEGILILTGRFNQDAIIRYVRSKSAPVVKPYEGTSVFMIPDEKTDAVEKGLAFLGSEEIALGDLESLKGVLDIKAKGNKSILSNPTMAPLIGSISPEEMFWFAADSGGVLARTSATAPLGTSASSIRGFVGTLNISEAVSGKITATAQNADAAAKLGDAVRGLIALGQLAGDRRPELRALLGGVSVSQNSDQVSIVLNFSADLLDKIGQSGTFSKQQ